MGKIDQLTNEYMSDKARFADVFNYFVYDGRQVLIPEYLHELSTVEQVFPYGKDGKFQKAQRFRDVLKNACVMILHSSGPNLARFLSSLNVPETRQHSALC